MTHDNTIGPAQPIVPEVPGGPPQAPKRRRWPWITAIVLAFLVGIGAGQAGGSGTTPTSAPEKASAAAPQPKTEPAEVEEPEPAPPPEPTYHKPKAADFDLNVKVKSRQCFGSAGCHLEYDIKPTYNGGALDPDLAYEVTYEVRGMEDGAQINTFTLTMEADGGKYRTETPSDELASTSSSSAKLTAKVVAVDSSERY